MRTQEKTLSQLRELASRNHHAAFIFRILGESPRPKPNVDLYRLRLRCEKGGHTITKDAIVDIFDKLQGYGLGKVKLRPLPDHSVFTWTIESSEARILCKEVSRQLLATRPTVSHSEGISVKPSQTHTIDLYATIDGALVHLRLPAPWTRSKANQLSQFLNQIAERTETTG